MSVFRQIMDTVFGQPHHAESSRTTASPSASQTQTAEIKALIEKMATARSEGENWRTSILELMRALDIDSKAVTTASSTANTLIEELTSDFSKQITKEAAKIEDAKHAQ